MKNLRILTITLVCVVLLGSAVHATIDPLYIGVGARPLGMGKAYVGLAEDGDTVFINPAGLGRMSGPKLTSMYTELMGDVRYVVLGGAYPLPVGTLGGGIVSANVSDIALYDQYMNSLGVAEYGNNVFFFSYGLDLGKELEIDLLDNVQVGASLKYFTQGGAGDITLEAGSGSGFDMDFGILYSPLSWLSLGYAHSNLLSSTVMFEETGYEEDIPAIAKLGANVEIIGRSGLLQYDALYGEGDQKLNLAMDYDMSSDDPVAGAAHIGLEYYPIKYFAVRLGMDQNPGVDGTVSNLTAGIGLRYEGIEFNYAYHPYDGIADNTTHFFSISYVGPEEEVVETPRADMQLELLEPRDKTITREDKLDVAVRIINMKPGTKVAVNGAPVEVGEDGIAETTFKLEGYGKKLVKATATDPDGNTLEATARILRFISFKDVQGDYWAREPIEHSGTVGLVEGYPDDTFKPERALSRAELATMLVRAKGVDLPDVSVRPFSDVPTTHWAARYIEAAKRMGLVEGYPDGTFRPNSKISRAEGILVLSRFDGLREPEKGELVFAPYNDVPVRHWAAGMVHAAKEAEFLDYVKSSYLKPKEAFPRSEAVYILAKTGYAKEMIDWLVDWEVGFDEDSSMAAPIGEKVDLISFQDVPGRHWASTPIKELASAGIVTGYPDGTFKPERTLSRAELATLLIKSRGIKLPVLRKAPFTDVPKAHWAALYIQAAVDMGLVRGYPDGSFGPNKKVTRSEAITVIDRFDGIEIPYAIYQRPFPDVPIDHWAARFIDGGKNAGILEYLAGRNFEPSKGLTRAEAAEMISKTKFGKGIIEQLYGKESGPKAEYEIDYSYKGEDKEDSIVVD